MGLLSQGLGLFVCGQGRYPTPQAAHVHHFPAAAWARLAAFWPDLEEDLAQAAASLSRQDS